MATPHDTFFHFTFRHTHHAGPWLQTALPPALVARLRWATLRPVPERLHGRALRLGLLDSVFTCKFIEAPGRTFLLSEHRSHDDPSLHGALVRYSVHLAHSLRRDRAAPPIPVIPVVLYHGPGPCIVAAPAHGALAAIDPAAAAMLARLQPQLAVIVDDLSSCDEISLRARALTPLGTLTLLALRFLPGLTPAATCAAIDRWGDLIGAVDRSEGPPVGADALEAFGWYVLHVTDAEPEDVHVAMQRHLQRPEDSIMTTAKRLRLEGRREGEKEGEARGEARGDARGEVRGRADTLQRLLTRRFGPLPDAIVTRLQQATPTELAGWTDRVLDAATLAAVFAAD